jgi:DNA-binding CsgD family transcriptional regulator
MCISSLQAFWSGALPRFVSAGQSGGIVWDGPRPPGLAQARMHALAGTAIRCMSDREKPLSDKNLGWLVRHSYGAARPIAGEPREGTGRWAGRRERTLILAACVMLALLLAQELVFSDEPVTIQSLFADFLEWALLAGSTIASGLLILRMRAQEEESHVLRRDLQVLRAEGQRWREEMAEHLYELGNGIRRQFDAWSLTPAEQEIGLLLLKGLSHKEIANLRSTSEATIRQQAASIYQKSSLSGRAALSAFFLEDLLDQPVAPNREPARAAR